MLFGNRSFIGYYQNPIPDVNAFLEHTFNNDNFMFDLLMENSYEEDGNIILSESSVVDFIGKFFKAIKDAIVKFIKMIKDFITGAVAKLKSLFSKKKKEVEEKKKEIEEKKEEKEKEEKLPTSAAQIAAGGAVGAALAAAKTVEKKDTSTPKTSSTKTSSTTTKTTSTVASKPQSTTSSTKTTAGSGFSPAARKSAEKATQQKPTTNIKSDNSSTSKIEDDGVRFSDKGRVLKDVSYISYSSLCNDFMDIIDKGTNEIEILEILNMKSELSLAKQLGTGTHYRASIGERRNKSLPGSSVKRSDLSLNNIDSKGGGEGYLFIQSYEAKVEEIKYKQNQMYPDVLLGDINKYPLINSKFTKNTNGTTFRGEVQEFSTISDDELSKSSYRMSVMNLGHLNVYRLYESENKELEKLTDRFNKWKDNIEKSLKAIVKDLDNTEKQVSKYWMNSDRENIDIKFDNYVPQTNYKITQYNRDLEIKAPNTYNPKDLEYEIMSNKHKISLPKKPLMDYLTATKGFINDILSSITSLANCYPKLAARGSNYMYKFYIQYSSMIFD